MKWNIKYISPVMERKNTMGLSIEQEKDEEKKAGPDVFCFFFGVKKKRLVSLCVT
jgi:hypothetical protein